MKKITTPLSTLKALILLLLLSTSVVLYAQPSIQWQKCIGGSTMDNAYSIVATNDGGYIMVGESKSNDIDISGHHGSTDTMDVLVIKTDALGAVQWQKSLGGNSWDYSSMVKQTSDGGYVLVGTAFSNDGDVSGSHGTADVWVVKLDVTGTIQWEKTLGGTSVDLGKTIQQTNDGGFIIGAVTYSNDGDVSGNHGGYDLWIVKTDNAGTIEWQKCLGGTSHEGQLGTSLIGYNTASMEVFQSADGGYFVGSTSCSNDGDLTNHYGAIGLGNGDYWVVKLDNIGSIQWKKSMGGTGHELIHTALQNTDGTYIVAGISKSTDFDVVGNHNGTYDTWLVKFDTLGAVIWTKALGGLGTDRPCSISSTTDGGYFITGQTTSQNGGDVAGRKGGTSDAWVLKIDMNGILQWQKCLGGTNAEIMPSGFQTSDGGYICAGWTSSNDIDVVGHTPIITSTTLAIKNDVWIVKLSPLPTNVISGTIFEDLNYNCVRDTNELGLEGRVVKAMPGNYYATTDINGNYTMFVDSGSYTINHTPPTFYNQSCPAGPGVYAVTINSLNPNSYTNNFADTLNSHCSDLKVSISGGWLRRCFKNNYGIHYSNTGAVPVSNATVSVTLDPQIIFLSSSMPYTVVGNQYVFNLGTLNSGQTGLFTITDSVSCAAIIGTPKCVTAIIATDPSECDSSNNITTDCHLVVGSCDPNSLQVASQTDSIGYLTQENITASDTLTYLINFQNIGNDTAFTVIVRDTLSNLLDGASIELGASGHPYTFRIYGQGICEWTFNNILLPDSTTNELGSHGFLKFSIQQTPGNTPGTIINNGAAIWFDYNEFLPTNSTTNIIPLAVNIVSISKTDKATLVYPNPFSSSTTISVNDKLQNAELVVYDITGKEVKVMKNLNGHEILVERNNLINGIYLYRILENNKFIGSGKLIIE